MNNQETDVVNDVQTEPNDLASKMLEQARNAKTAQKMLESVRSKTPSELITFDNDGRPVVNATGYTRDELLEDRFLEPIKDYMSARFGSQTVEREPEDIVNLFINNMRGFSGGNSVRAASELAFLNSIESEEEKKKAAKAYAIFEGMDGLFGETTTGEKADILWDYTRSAVFDPINVLTFGIGKAATSGGLKLMSNMAQKTATKSMLKKGVTKASSEALKMQAVKEASGVFAKVATQQKIQATKQLATREAIKAASTEIAKSKLNQQVWKEIAVTGAMDGIAASSTDYAYQNAMIRTKVQDDFSLAQTGIAAFSSIILMGSVQGASQLARRASTAGPTAFKVKTDGVSLTNLISNVQGKPKPPSVKRLSRTGKKIDLANADTEFFVSFILGDDSKGIEGLAHTLAEQGYGWRPRDADDTITQFMADVIEQLDPSDFKTVIKEYTDQAGIALKDMDDLSPKEFAKVFQDKISNQGSVLNAQAQTAKLLGTDAKNISVEDHLEFQITGKVPKRSSAGNEATEAFANRFGIPKDSVSAVQNRLIRLLVSNPATSMLNIRGYGVTSTLNSVTDVSMAALTAGAQVFQEAGSAKGLKEAKQTLLNSYRNQRFKLANTLDPNTTFDMFKKYGDARPRAVAELMRVLPGGVENVERLADGFDPNISRLGNASDSAIDTIQKYSLVTAQDSYTKSIEFVTQLDKNLRNQFGMGYEEFFQHPDYQKMMMSPEFSHAEFKAVDETLTTIFSKSYKNPKTAVGELAGFIEDVRNIPGLGILMPFGRFFNNTIAFIGDHSGISLGMRISGYKGKGTRSTPELFVRSAISAVAVAAMLPKEQEYIDKGYAWNQEDDIDGSGAVNDVKFTFPYGAYKAAARMAAYAFREDDLPPDTFVDISETFVGQMTKELGNAGEGILAYMNALASADGPVMAQESVALVGTISSQAVAMGTRFLEPVNVGVGLARGEGYRQIDTKQGATVAREATKYMNQVIDVMTGGNMEEKFSPTQGRKRLQPAKMFSGAREVDMTDLERLYNIMGEASYKAGNRDTQVASVKNRYAELFDDLNQDAASWLLEDKAWRDASLKQKKQFWTKLASENKERVLDYMKAGVETGDYKTSLILEVEQKTSRQELKEMLTELDFTEELDEMSLDDLLSLQTYAEMRDDIMRYEVYGD